MADDLKRPQPGDPAHLRAAFELEGLKEVVGGRHEDQVLRFFADAGQSWVKDDETAWCAAFAHSMLGQGGIKGTGSLAARSYLDWGTKTTAPKRGDVVVFKRGTSKWQGHVAFFLSVVGERIWVIGGNQGNAVSVASYPKSALLGYRRPPGAAAAPKPAPRPRPAAPAPAAVEPMSAAAPEVGTPTRETILSVQEQLKVLGYSEVGKADGEWGPMTEAAILAFRKDNGLPMLAAIDDELGAALLKAKPRVLAPERTNATPKEVRQEVPEVQSNWLTKVGAFFAMIFAGVGTSISGIFANLGGAKEFVRPVLDVASDIPPWVYFLLIGGAALWLFLVSRKGEQHGVAAFQAGERR